MHTFIRLSLSSWFFFILLAVANGQTNRHANKQGTDPKRAPALADYLSLDGQVLPAGNPAGPDGNVYRVKVPLLRLVRSRSGSPKGTLLVLPGGDYNKLELNGEIATTTRSLDTLGYNTATLEYSVSADLPTRDTALKEALQAFRLLKTKQAELGLPGTQLSIIGFSSGGHLAARTVQKLGEGEQPDDLLLISPVYLDEKLAGTVLPAVMPPVRPTARLFTVVVTDDQKSVSPNGRKSVSAGGQQSVSADDRKPVSPDDQKSWIDACREYTKVWKGYDGWASFHLLPDETKQLSVLLKEFLGSAPVPRDSSAVNPAAIAVASDNVKRHAEKLQLVAKEKFELILVGNSITHNFEKPEYQPVWSQFFAPRKALNLGFSGYRTENILWNIEHGELEGQSPKVVVLEIGTNNVDEKHYPTRHTAGQLAGGIEAIVRLLRQKLPDAKIIVLRCFPGSYDGPNPTSHRAILNRASEIVSRLADGKNIFYCDVNHVFLNLDGSINHALMPDWLHPSPAGAKAWAQAMEPLLSQLMGDHSLDTEIPANTAIVPVSKLEDDSYDWWGRHSEVLRIKDSINPEIILIGNSITHFWGGLPALKSADGQPRQPNGPRSWAALFDGHRVLNLGFGWDRTQNVLWRLDHGELDGLHPRLVIINIGTNNTSETAHARMNTAPEIVEGIRAICARVRSKTPGAKIILMAVLPREQSPQHPRRILINRVNGLLEAFAKEEKITFVDIGSRWLAPDGVLLPGMTLDFTHPTEKGYQVWADGIRPFVAEP